MNTKTNNLEPLLTELRASELLGISYNNLRMWLRPQGKISFIRVGKNGIRCSLLDIQNYIRANRVEAKTK
jgi:predicted site-specific integrase-resolvase